MQPSTRPAPVDVPRAVLELLRGAETVTAFTGAGMSAESGIPTFRDAQTGLWARYSAADLATVDAWSRDPALVWGWYQHRARLARASEPNDGHIALATLAERCTVGIVTQNVDDLHERAGSNVTAHLHGSLFAPRCRHCGTRSLRADDADAPAPTGDPDAPDPEALRQEPPMCVHCRCEVRPGVVWFGEPLPVDEWGRAEAAVLAADVVLAIGTSGVVYPAARLPEIALATGIPVVEINPDETSLSEAATACWRATAATALPALVAALNAH
ncbi:SIR2 family NAD-dependent protein deacylase [Tsukamurella soli]|uniref:NAD-dependent protein deacylase n=1 Tax=Tsukamurella soli TaxID=644556 RepID=A0ABP8KHJ6_9ACTN